MQYISKSMKFCWPVLIAGLLLACGGSGSLNKLEKSLAQYPEYDVILADMREEGNFFPEYYHRYKVVYKTSSDSNTAFQEELSDWVEVGKRDYQRNYNNLGMTIMARSDSGAIDRTAQPPGYRHAGDPRYGEWRRDNDGNSFWAFYGRYAMMRTAYDMISGRRLYRSEYDDYRKHRRNRRPYYGKSNQYGTEGSYTKQTRPTFFQRRQALENSRRRSFQDRVRNRSNRSNMSRSRRRSGGWGK